MLEDIVKKCFKRLYFRRNCTQAVLDYAFKRHGDLPEFLWERFPDTAVLRRKDTGKWYAVVLTIQKNKLGLEGEEVVEVIDLRFDPERIEEKIDRKRFFGGYHMNKKHWITVLTDGSVEAEEICSYLEWSYVAAK